MTLKEKIIIREAIQILEKQLSEDTEAAVNKETPAPSEGLLRVEKDGIISFVRSVTIPSDKQDPPMPPKPLPPGPPKPLNKNKPCSCSACEAMRNAWKPAKLLEHVF